MSDTLPQTNEVECFLITSNLLRLSLKPGCVKFSVERQSNLNKVEQSRSTLHSFFNLSLICIESQADSEIQLLYTPLIQLMEAM